MTHRHTLTATFIGFLLVAGLTVQFRPWTWPWPTVRSDLGDRYGLIVACFAAGLGVAWLLSLRPERAAGSPDPGATRWPWLLSFRGMTTLVAAVLVAGVVALSIMIHVASGAGTTERPKLQIEAIKYGLGIFAAAGAIAALLVGVRRQRHTEQAPVLAGAGGAEQHRATADHRERALRLPQHAVHPAEGSRDRGRMDARPSARHPGRAGQCPGPAPGTSGTPDRATDPDRAREAAGGDAGGRSEERVLARHGPRPSAGRRRSARPPSRATSRSRAPPLPGSPPSAM